MAAGKSLLGVVRTLVGRVRRRKQTSKERGDELEARVVNILRLEGKWNIRRNVMIKDTNGNKSEIDVTYGLFWHRFVECKNYATTQSVPLEDVAKFKEVLRLNGISASRGLFVTTSTYSPRSTTIGIRTVDGKQLKEWEIRAAAKARIRYVFRIAVLGSCIIATVALYHDPSLMDRTTTECRKLLSGLM